MTTEAKPIVDSDNRRRILTEALDIQIQRRIRRARQLRKDAKGWHGDRAATLRGLAQEEDRLRERAEQIKKELT